MILSLGPEGGKEYPAVIVMVFVDTQLRVGVEAVTTNCVAL